MDTEVRTPRPHKVAVVDEVRERLGHSEATILTEYRGLSVAQLQLLRRALTPAGGEYKVYKNTLVRRAAKEGGLEELEALLTGPTALAFVTGGDVSAVAKALKEFARQHPSLVVKGAVIGGGLFDA
ncbi:MAG: 50S ribosomal protein L10, partial [Acidimicrobiales bacterium]